MNVHSNFIGISSKLEITQISFCGCMIHPYNGIILINTNKEFHLCDIYEIIIEMKYRFVLARGKDVGRGGG